MRNRVRPDQVNTMGNRPGMSRLGSILSRVPASESLDERMFRRRFRTVCALVVIAIIGLVGQMVRLQGAAGEKLVEKGRVQRTDTYKVEAQRGSILDRNGVELAVSIPRRTVAVHMERLAQAGVIDWVDYDAFAKRIAPYVDLPADEVAQKLKNSGSTDPYVVIKRNVPISKVGKLVEDIQRTDRANETNLLNGLLVERSSERINPAGDSGLRIIGRLGMDGPAKMAGIERAFDAQLRGIDGENRVELKNGSDRSLSGWAAIVNGEGKIDLSRKGGALPDSEQVLKEAVAGSSVQLTIDRAMQHDVERILMDGAAKAGARRGVAVVGKPGTGELLAVASVEVDSETGQMGLSDAPLAFANSYQAGSVFKLVTVAAGIESGEVAPETVLSVPDRLKVSDRTYRDHDPHATEPMSVTDIVAKSSNVGTILIAQQLGKKRLYDALRNFGFGEKTDIAHPAEAAGLVPDYTKWTDPDLASSSIGTHESATALQLWAAYNVVANDGMYVPPRLVDSVLHPDGTRQSVKGKDPRRVLSAESAKSMSGILQSVITDGTAKQWTLPGYSIAAKTGTSRMPSPKRVDRSDGYMWEDGRYHYLAAFTGFLSAERPQVSITVILDDVNSGLYGSTAAGPIFSQIARLSIRDLGIAPDGSDEHRGDEELLPGTVRVSGGRIRASAATSTTTTTTPAKSSSNPSGSTGTSTPTEEQ